VAWSRRHDSKAQLPGSGRKQKITSPSLLPCHLSTPSPPRETASTRQTQGGYRTPSMSSVDWYCSEPRLAFTPDRGLTLSLSFLGSRQLPPGTINLRLGAVRRLRLRSGRLRSSSRADLAAGIRRVKGVKKLGIRLGNWLTAEQGNAALATPASSATKGKRDRALLALLPACGLRRA